jgi:hypothetical protein
MKKSMGMVPAIVLMGAASAWAEAPGTYSVPVEPELAAHASFEVPGEPLWTVQNGRRVLKYILPADLVGGRTVHVQLEGSDQQFNGFYRLSAGETFAVCLEGRQLTCLSHYGPREIFGVDVDQGRLKALEYLREKYAADPALAQRLKVAASFGGDPAGTLVLR